MKNTLFILALFTSYLVVAQNVTSKFDTVYFHENEFENEEDEYIVHQNSDSALAGLPAYYLYNSWDTINIHPYKNDLSKSKDTFLLKLTYDPVCDYVHPFCGKTTSNYGFRKYRPHYGIDVDLETGDSVLCCFDGKVRIAKKSKSYGNVVVVRHNNGLETVYAHLSKINVKINDDVSAGTLLGLGGNTGRSTGSHLHFEVRYLGLPIDPNELASFSEFKLKSDTLSITNKTFNLYTESKKAKYHTIKKGDTLGHIARRYGTSVNKLCKLNGIKSTSILRVGKSIRVR